MRVINQNGLTSYDIGGKTIYIMGKYIHMGEAGDTPILLGTYKSQEESLEVFRDLHTHFDCGDTVYRMPQR